jgi:hypothetical protein
VHLPDHHLFCATSLHSSQPKPTCIPKWGTDSAVLPAILQCTSIGWRGFCCTQTVTAPYGQLHASLRSLNKSCEWHGAEVDSLVMYVLTISYNLWSLFPFVVPSHVPCHIRLCVSCHVVCVYMQEVLLP